MTSQLILISLFASVGVFGQTNNHFLGTWIKKESVPDNLIEEPFSDTRFTKYEFRDHGIVYYSNSHLERGVPGKYRVTDDQKLSLNYIFHKIVSFTKTELIISDDQNNVIHLIKISEPKEIKDLPQAKTDIVYKSNFKLHPVINLNIDLHSYFFFVNEYIELFSTTYDINGIKSTSTSTRGNVTDDILIKVTFIVSKTGHIEDVKILESTKPKKDSKYISKIIATSGYWTPAILNDETVNTEVTLTFKKLGLKTINKLNKADIQFNKGQKHFEKGDFLKSIDLITEALTINPTNQRYLFLRAKAYLELNHHLLRRWI